ncbi:MAG TPA: S9 family peptidase [Thermoanaerobaculia bacterium]|jgi:dipeptidyl aminopeptidase/acylaminoacyl peptidase
MKKTALVLFSIIIAAPAFAQVPPISIDDLLAIKRVGSPRLSPDNRWIAFDESTIDMKANMRHSAIHLLPVSGGASRTITDGAKQDEGPAWSPDGKWIAYVSNRDTAAKQVWLYDVTAGTQKRVSNLDGGASSVKWMPDGKGVIVVSDVDVEPAPKTHARIITSLLYRHWNAWQSPSRSHILYVPLDGGAARDLTPGVFDAPPFSLGGGDEFDVSPDGKELAFARNTDEHPELSTNSDVFIVSMTGGEARRITTRRGADTAPVYSPDGKFIAYRSQSRAGYESDLFELWLYDRATGQSTRLAADFPNWIEAARWAPDSKSLYVIAPYQGADQLFQITLDGKYRIVEGFGSVSDFDVAKNNETLYEARSSITGPTEIYAIDKRTAKSQRLTHENDALLTSVKVGLTHDFYWTGADGVKIEGHLVTPPDFDPNKKYPALVLIHGGPQGAWSDAWSYRWNPEIFASRGYVILMPNPRGSTGFGQQFTEEISGDWGGRAYIDIMNGVDALAALPYIDGSRLGAAGASFGGYMIDWILGHTDRFKALMSHDGVFNTVSMYGATEELWFPEFEFKGNPYDNPELYEKWSPSNFVKNFKTPTLVVHGELDFRVPIDQGLQLFTALQRRGVPSKMLIFPDEGHWVLKPQNSRLWYTTALDWFDEWVKK